MASHGLASHGMAKRLPLLNNPAFGLKMKNLAVNLPGGATRAGEGVPPLFSRDPPAPGDLPPRGGCPLGRGGAPAHRSDFLLCDAVGTKKIEPKVGGAWGRGPGVWARQGRGDGVRVERVRADG